MTNQTSQMIARRLLIKRSLGFAGSVAGLALGAGPFSRMASAQGCVRTPTQTRGPFYPVDFSLGVDMDLTWVEGRSVPAAGEIIYVRGVVLDQNCTPVPNAQVEIWQAAASGRYSHPGDQSGLDIDPNFQGFGRAQTDEQGRWIFKTIKPGKYPAAPGWERPPHIHFKVSKRGYRELVTQMYFAGDPLNDEDRVLQGLPAEDRASLVVELRDPEPSMDPLARLCDFPITLERLF